MKIDRKGSTRIVFIGKRYVYKIPNTLEWRLFLHGLLANMSERQWNGRHKNFARIKWSDPWGLIVVMERVTVIEHLDWGLFKRYIEKKFNSDELADFLLSDCKPANWGYKDGKLLKIDYGN